MGKYSFSTAALFPRTAAESLRLIGGAGFRYAELMPQCFAEARESFALEAERCGVQVASVHYPLAMFSMLYNAGDSMVPEAREFGAGLVRLCSRLGAKILVVHPHEPPKDRARSAIPGDPVARNLRFLGEECAAAGLRLAVENNPKGPGRTPGGLLEYIAGLGAGLAAAPMVDTTEACESGEDPAAFIAAVKPCHLHMSDHSGEAKHLPAGEGDTDWRAVRTALEGCGYDGFLTLEPLWRYYVDEPERELAKAYRFLSTLMEPQE